MLEDGGYEVTILDRCETLPAPDAASTGMFNFCLMQAARDDIDWDRPEQDYSGGRLCRSRFGKDGD
jgi:hypothetical protein